MVVAWKPDSTKAAYAEARMRALVAAARSFRDGAGEDSELRTLTAIVRY
jgi:hypothetical protein